MHRYIPLLAAMALGLSACDQQEPAGPMFPAMPVSVAQPVHKDVVEWDEYTGRFAAIESVEVRARVSGYLESIHFTEGEIVEVGDLLFVIDPRPFEAAVDRAKADLDTAESRLELARKEVERAADLVRRQNVSQQAYDERLQEQQAAAASIDGAKAALRAAGLDLEFTRITAPVTGRVSRFNVTVGNLISGGAANSTLLTTLVSLDPIHFYFDADEQAHLRYLRAAQAGTRPSSREAANPVLLSLADETDFIHQGHMDFLDNQIDNLTGTIRGRALFDNGDGLFVPGMFARIRLLGSGRYKAILVPDEAIGTDQNQRLVYVIDAEDTVSVRYVELGPMIDGLRVIRAGVAPDDWVIVRGLQRARPGGKVVPERIRLDSTPSVADAS